MKLLGCFPDELGSTVSGTVYSIRARLTEVRWWMSVSMCSCSLLRPAHTTCWKTLVTRCWVPAHASSTRDRWFVSITQYTHIHREALLSVETVCKNVASAANKPTKAVLMFDSTHFCIFLTTTLRHFFILKSIWNTIHSLFYFHSLINS